jgi:hypothetical protein
MRILIMDFIDLHSVDSFVASLFSDVTIYVDCEDSDRNLLLYANYFVS